VPKKIKFALIGFVLVLALSTSFAAGCIIGGAPGERTGLEVISQAWAAIYQNYVDPSRLDSANLTAGAIKGIMSALNDPYSAYFDPEMYQMFQSNLQGKFEGIGAEVSSNSDNQPVIITTLPDSPAARAGIESGDVILAVNGKTTEGMSLVEVALTVRGPAGTTVTLTILHQGATDPVDIQVIREQINTSTVDWEMKGNIAYIRITQFAANTNDELNTALQSIDMKTTIGVILDLRDNPGGQVPAVVDVASHFLKEGVVITLVDNKGNRSSASVQPNGVYTDLPIVVLVNQYSASGAEVLAGALRDYKRATIAGTRTFGKGSYDIDIPLKDGSDIYLTIGRWLTPNGQLIEGKGIEPDYVLTETGDAEIQWAIDFLEQSK
jgi:carboxyl-terminal processing protease